MAPFPSHPPRPPDPGPQPGVAVASCSGDPADGAELARLSADYRHRPAVLTLTGQFDLASAGMTRAALDRLRTRVPDRVDVDVQGVTFIDCAGLDPLLCYQQDAGPGQLRLRGSSPAVDRLLRALAGAAAPLPAAG